MRHHRLTRSAALAFALVALTVPTAAASGGSQDLRSADAIDAATTAARHPGQDLRSPDARDMRRGPDTPFGGSVTSMVRAPEASGGFDWSAAVIGAGSVLGLMLLAMGTVVLVYRRHGARPATTA